MYSFNASAVRNEDRDYERAPIPAISYLDVHLNTLWLHLVYANVKISQHAMLPFRYPLVMLILDAHKTPSAQSHREQY